MKMCLDFSKRNNEIFRSDQNFDSVCFGKVWQFLLQFLKCVTAPPMHFQAGARVFYDLSKLSDM